MNLTNPVYQDETKAREQLESIRWPDGPFCPHCGEAEKIGKLNGDSHRNGVHKCYSCRKPFTVTVGTVFERSKIPLHKWILATHLMSVSKKGYSTHQLHRTLGVTYKTAWFMAHRIREAMREPNPTPMGGEGQTVEADETFWGNPKRRWQSKKGRGYHHKEKVLTLVERGGRVRSFHVPSVTANTLRPILREQIHQDTQLVTDEAPYYVLSKPSIKKDFHKHDYVQHRIKEYVRGDIHTNTIENYFSILKRGLTGVYQHVGAKHLMRYLGEFDFRYDHRAKLGYDDTARARAALKGIGGKRLTYGSPNR